MNLRELAEAALDEISRTDPAFVYAAGRNKVMSTKARGLGYSIAFRLVGDRVRVERWPVSGLSTFSITSEWLSPALEARALALLDSMPEIRPLSD